MNGHIYMNVLFNCHVYLNLFYYWKKSNVKKRTKLPTEICQHLQPSPEPPSTKMNNRSIF